MENQAVKRIPYGVSDFVNVMERNQYYVDKTMYIPMLEDEADNLFFIRPRRFGKSILLSMLHAYYDIRTKDKFQQWFGSLWIGCHPTPLQGRYQILHLDFSQVGGTIETLEEKFNFYLGTKLDEFIHKYAEFYPESIQKKVIETTDANGKLLTILYAARDARYPLYLFIDEYDDFTNTALNEQNKDVDWAITHTERFYRDIFTKFKGSFEKTFITGTSPLMLYDMNNGFNIGWHISTKEQYNQMLGFSTEEVREIFTYYKNMGNLPEDADIEAIISEIKPWYGNYCFSEDALETQSKVFNSNMVLHYMSNYMNNGRRPEEIINPNTKISLKELFPHDKNEEVRKETIRKLLQDCEIKTTLQGQYSFYDILKPELLASMLYYKGILTRKGTMGSLTILSFPNNSIRKLYESELTMFLQ